MNLHWYDLVGTLGVALILFAYVLLQLERVDAKALSYSVLNLVGALLITISLLYEFNFSALVIEIFWIAISIYGIWRYYRRDSTCGEGEGSRP